MKITFLSVCAVLLALTNVKASFLQYGDLYSSNYFSTTIKHYTPSGQYIDSYTLPISYGTQVKGIAPGPGGLLYTVNVTDSGFGVTTIDREGTATTIANGNDYIAGNLSYGKIAVSKDGAFYISGQDNLTAFAPGSNTGTVIYSENQVFDVDILPSGNLLVLSAYGLEEITPAGTIVRDINTSIRLVDARGLEYDPITNSIYVTMLGYTGQSFRLMKIDADTGNVDTNIGFWYGDDLFFTMENTLLVGSRTQTPGIFDANLNMQGTLTSGEQMFVTQMTSSVPIPSSVWLLSSAMVGLFAVTRKKSR